MSYTVSIRFWTEQWKQKASCGGGPIYFLIQNYSPPPKGLTACPSPFSLVTSLYWSPWFWGAYRDPQGKYLMELYMFVSAQDKTREMMWQKAWDESREERKCKRNSDFWRLQRDMDFNLMFSWWFSSAPNFRLNNRSHRSFTLSYLL